jgi:hypothetical protein
MIRYLVTTLLIVTNDEGQGNIEIDMFGLIAKWAIHVGQCIYLLSFHKGFQSCIEQLKISNLLYDRGNFTTLLLGIM